MKQLAQAQALARLMSREATRLLKPTSDLALQRTDGTPADRFRTIGLMLFDDEIQSGDDQALADAFTLFADAATERNDATIRINDGLGHSRPIYAPLVLSIMLTVYHKHIANVDNASQKACREALASIMYRLDLPMLYDTPETALTLWKALCWLRHDSQFADESEAAGTRALVDAIAMTPGRDGALHPFNESEQLLDTWWYNELSGLHAMANIAILTRKPAWQKRVAEIAEHHLMNIQADHTTSQPWGLAAFVLQSETRIFAEQQLHEAAAGVRSPFAQSNVLTGLLLADAAYHLQLAFSQDFEADNPKQT